jgi:hypothetical protein
MAKKEAVGGVGLAPSAMYEGGGGLLDDVDATIEEAAFVMFDYNGKAPVPIPAAYLKLVGEDGEAHDQYWSIGKDFSPNEDGSGLVATGTATGINKGSNFGILMSSIVEAGFPENRLGESIKVLEGLKCHLARVAAPKRSTQRAPRADGKVYDETILTINKIYQLPWEKGAGKGKVGGKGAKVVGVEDSSLDEELQEAITGILLEKGGEVTRQQLAAAVFQSLKENPNRNAMVKRAYEDEFLKNGPWAYDKGTISMMG